MEKIRLIRNIKRIEVNDDGEYIELDFDDLNLPYRYYGMLKQLQRDRVEFAQTLEESLKGKSENESRDILIEKERELNVYFCNKIDEVFGKDTCRKVYGYILPSLEMHLAFFDAIKPYFEEEAKRRQQKMSRYNARRIGDA